MGQRSWAKVGNRHKPRRDSLSFGPSGRQQLFPAIQVWVWVFNWRRQELNSVPSEWKVSAPARDYFNKNRPTTYFAVQYHDSDFFRETEN